VQYKYHKIAYNILNAQKFHNIIKISKRCCYKICSYFGKKIELLW